MRKNEESGALPRLSEVQFLMLFPMARRSVLERRGEGVDEQTLPAVRRGQKAGALKYRQVRAGVMRRGGTWPGGSRALGESLHSQRFRGSCPLGQSESVVSGGPLIGLNTLFKVQCGEKGKKDSFQPKQFSECCVHQMRNVAMKTTWSLCSEIPAKETGPTDLDISTCTLSWQADGDAAAWRNPVSAAGSKRSALGALAWEEDRRALGSFTKQQELYVERFSRMDAVK